VKLGRCGGEFGSTADDESGGRGEDIAADGKGSHEKIHVKFPAALEVSGFQDFRILDRFVREELTHPKNEKNEGPMPRTV